VPRQLANGAHAMVDAGATLKYSIKQARTNELMTNSTSLVMTPVIGNTSRGN
jgi:hypothetical protein